MAAFVAEPLANPMDLRFAPSERCGTGMDRYGYQPGFAKYDGNVVVSKGTWTIALLGTNLSNKVTKSFAYNFSGIGVANIDETRSVKLQARFRF